MDRDDFIKNREDIITNIKTLYSYLNGEQSDEYKNWAIEKMARGKNFVVEIINSKIYFAPSRFVGYRNNTKEKHEENHGDGRLTDEKISVFYQMVEDDRLDVLFHDEVLKYGIPFSRKKYWIDSNMTVNDIIYQINSTTQYTPITADCDKYWHIQMHLPEGKGGTEIDSSLMLLEAEPIIGTGEWDNFQCKDFKEIDNGNIVLVRKGNQAIALCQICGDNFNNEELTDRYLNINFRKVRILAWADSYKQPRSGLFIYRKEINACLDYIDKYNVITGKALSGHLGESDENGQVKVLATTKIILPGEVCTESYIVMGKFDTKFEANNLYKYLCTKVVRFLLLQALPTMDIRKESFRFVPLQDFTNSSDIDWSKSIEDIGRQLYRKYGLDDKEIGFIERMIKPME